MSPSNVGSLRLRMQPKDGWHIVPDAPVRLSIEAPAARYFAAPEQRSEDALEHSEQNLEFALTLRSDVAVPAEGQVEANIKFGICLDNAEGCEIVRETVEFPLVPRPSS